MPSEKVIVYEVDRHNVRALSPKEVKNTYCGELTSHTIGTIPIGKGSRKVDVILKGSCATNEVDAHVATVTIPFEVMIQRYMGYFKVLTITSDRCTGSDQTNHEY